MKGEGRHRRSHLYDLESGEVTWLFRNNTVRTVAPEYEWAPSPDGTKLLIVAERDGNTVSPERGVYLMDLNRKVTREELLARVRTNLEAEAALRAKAEAMYGPIAEAVRMWLTGSPRPGSSSTRKLFSSSAPRTSVNPGTGPPSTTSPANYGSSDTNRSFSGSKPGARDRKRCRPNSWDREP